MMKASWLRPLNVGHNISTSEGSVYVFVCVYSLWAGIKATAIWFGTLMTWELTTGSKKKKVKKKKSKRPRDETVDKGLAEWLKWDKRWKKKEKGKRRIWCDKDFALGCYIFFSVYIPRRVKSYISWKCGDQIGDFHTHIDMYVRVKKNNIHITKRRVSLNIPTSCTRCDVYFSYIDVLKLIEESNCTSDRYVLNTCIYLSNKARSRTISSISGSIHHHHHHHTCVVEFI